MQYLTIVQEKIYQEIEMTQACVKCCLRWIRYSAMLRCLSALDNVACWGLFHCGFGYKKTVHVCHRVVSESHNLTSLCHLLCQQRRVICLFHASLSLNSLIRFFHMFYRFRNSMWRFSEHLPRRSVNGEEVSWNGTDWHAVITLHKTKLIEMEIYH